MLTRDLPLQEKVDPLKSTYDYLVLNDKKGASDNSNTDEDD